MKRVLKFLLPIIVIAMISAMFMIPSSAASSDAVYAVWDSEEQYLANPNRPMAKFTNNVLTTEALSNRGYVLCYSDVLVKDADVQLARAQNIIIDLNGHSLTASRKIIVNGSSSANWCEAGSLTIKNGTLIHTSSQFIQPRPNSEIYFENVDLIERANSGNFVYDASARIIYFKDCTVTIESGASLTMFSLAPAYSGANADMLYKDEDGGKLDYVRNVVFENTAFVDNSEVTATNQKVTIFYARGSETDFININFIYGSSFNQLRDNFINSDNPKANISVNVSKGARFAEQEVPVLTDEFDINYFDSIEVVNKHRVVFGKRTDLLESGEQNTVNPELIWGRSGDASYPYQLCQYLCDVNWYIQSEHIENQVITETGYADGLRLSYDAPAGTYYTSNGKVYVERHMGWSKTEGDTEYVEYVTLSAKEENFYSVFAEFPVYAVEYESAEMQTIVSGITENVITDAHIKSFSDGSYIYFYEDVVWGTDSSVVIPNIDLTFDLGGNTFRKNKVVSKNSGLLELDGTNLLIKNGTFESSMTGMAKLMNGANLVIENAEVVYDNSPAFTLDDGNLSFTDCEIVQSGTDIDVPFIVYTFAGNANAVIDECTVNVAGPVSTSIPSEGAGSATLDINKCGTVYADSLFALYDSVAARVAEGAKLALSLDATNVIAREVIDDCDSNLDAEFSFSGACMFSSKPQTENGLIVLPAGLKIVAFDGGVYGYTLGLDDISIKFNMELSIGFRANFYIAKSYPVTYTETYLGHVDVADMTTVEIDGVEFYVVSISGVSASDCFDVINLRIGYVGADENDYASEVAYDPADYFTELLEGTDPLNRKLSAAAVNYIATAYEYKTSVLPESLLKVLASDAYKASLRSAEEIPEDGVTAEVGNIDLAFKSAQLYLSSSLYVRFNIADGFTGTVDIDGTSYSIVNGKCGDATYVRVEISAYALYARAVEISGTAADGTAVAGAYSLNDYVNAFINDEGALGRMLNAFYSYCYEAFVYDNGGVLPPYIDHTPPLDAELG